jgi:hypothetical protein
MSRKIMSLIVSTVMATAFTGTALADAERDSFGVDSSFQTSASASGALPLKIVGTGVRGQKIVGTGVRGQKIVGTGVRGQ